MPQLFSQMRIFIRELRHSHSYLLEVFLEHLCSVTRISIRILYKLRLALCIQRTHARAYVWRARVN